MPTSIPIPQVKLGKRKERSQMCEVLTDDGRWVDREMPALFSCVADEAAHMSFLLDPENQYLAEDNNWHQLITEKSEIPLCLRKTSVYQDGKKDEKDKHNLSDGVYHLSWLQKKGEMFEKIKQSESWNKFLWIVSIVCGTMLIIAGMQFLRGG